MKKETGSSEARWAGMDGLVSRSRTPKGPDSSIHLEGEPLGVQRAIHAQERALPQACTPPGTAQGSVQPGKVCSLPGTLLGLGAPLASFALHIGPAWTIGWAWSHR